MTQEAVVKKIPRNFTDEEMLSKGKEMAFCQREAARVQVEAKQSSDRFKRKINDLKDREFKLGKEIEDGYEFRELLCELRLDRETSQRVWIDQDSGQEVLREPFESVDYQYDLGEAGA